VATARARSTPLHREEIEMFGRKKDDSQRRQESAKITRRRTEPLMGSDKYEKRQRERSRILRDRRLG
jgi:hypothetical protein